MQKSVSRHGDLFSIFKRGESALMNDIATLCVLYEDFRFETKHLADSLVIVKPGEDQEAFYWIRRSLLTMHEFGQRLNSICRSKEFQAVKHSIREGNERILVEARRFINKSPLGMPATSLAATSILN